jgi:hypothetical protein
MNALETRQMQILLEAIEHYCYTDAKLTLLTTDKQYHVLDLERQADNNVSYGSKPEAKFNFLTNLPKGGVLIIRSYTAELDYETGLPLKELRGMVIKADLSFLWLNPKALFNALYTDPNTGEELPVEPAVRYC